MLCDKPVGIVSRQSLPTPEMIMTLEALVIIRVSPFAPAGAKAAPGATVTLEALADRSRGISMTLVPSSLSASRASVWLTERRKSGLRRSKCAVCMRGTARWSCNALQTHGERRARPARPALHNCAEQQQE